MSNGNAGHLGLERASPVSRRDAGNVMYVIAEDPTRRGSGGDAQSDDSERRRVV